MLYYVTKHIYKKQIYSKSTIFKLVLHVIVPKTKECENFESPIGAFNKCDTMKQKF